MLDLNNKKDAKQIQDILRAGAKQEFWGIIQQAMENMLKHVQDELEQSQRGIIAEEYKIIKELAIEKKKFLTYFVDMPHELVQELDNPKFFQQETVEDVYKTSKDFE